MSILSQILIVLAISRHPFHSGLSRDFKNYQNMTQMTSDFYFTTTSWFPGNVRVKPHSKDIAPSGFWQIMPTTLLMPTSPRIFWRSYGPVIHAVEYSTYFLIILDFTDKYRKFFIEHSLQSWPEFAHIFSKNFLSNGP